ncbi:hypothetical protein PDPUS_1_01277 [Photobacterium damselae subsp. piscicida]|uniref:DUF5666 domain-containing protein n=1 Tax=Photobacterium damsela subsp. piscicida TaxID=38294 RepID=A0A1V1VAS1_PHODP|nr:DUF5666 domain-containing protein [Photobacterium damselae]MBE8129526.1 hypothetical protein [Photobacterium damselae subsp. piscicida]PSV78229.1 hypothetical protein CTT35_05415 [Photobacterium damselae]PSW80346.1 hypothetical protein CTT37_05755 [Photobacterium damselae]QOD51693.1 hypothetical protein IC628_09280 [Photobacterium damselae subsp. piscicida]QOD55549.1 hypothetical protein IC627_09310 [Photobacterium damselae subsp. piscicida]
MKKLALVTIISLILSGCGGGGSSDSGSTPKPDIKPETKPALVEGTIDKVNGSNIIVNGRSYQVASVNYANTPLADGVSVLKPQMMVQVSDVARAGATVFLDPTLLGKVTAVNHTTNTFTVNGVELSFAQLNEEIEINDWVMVSALPMATETGVGYKVLSVIEVENTDLAGKYELEGTLSQLDSAASTFKLGQVVVDYANIQLEPTIGNGDWVEVTGQMSNGVFVATEVEVDNYDDNEDFDDAEIEGVVTWINNEKTLFTLNARGQFVIDNSTRFEDGSRNNLKTGELVDVTAINGVAKEIEFDRDHDGDHEQGTWHEFDAEGIVSYVTDSTIILDTFNGASQTIYADNMTRYEDRLTLATLTGKRVEIEGIVRGGQKIAREIELED